MGTQDSALESVLCFWHISVNGNVFFVRISSLTMALGASLLPQQFLLLLHLDDGVWRKGG